MSATIVHVDVPHAPECINHLVLLGGDFLRRNKGLPDVQYRDARGRRHQHAWRLWLTQYRDARGRRHQHAWRLWLTLICNDTDCPAVVLVRADAIEQLAMDNGGLRDA